jgi:hypothetical protein
MKHAAAPDPSAPPAHLASWYMPGLSDGLGDRLLMFDNTATASLELLRFRQDFGDRSQFEDAVRQRMRELARFTHPALGQVRALKRLGEHEGLALVSNHVAGRRLSEILHAARGPALGLDLIRQLTPALAGLQQQGDNISHGILTPERIIVTPEGKLVMVEHVLGSALQSLNLPAYRLRSELGLALRGQHAPLDSRADVVQLGLAALSIVLGRRVGAEEYPMKVASLLDELESIDAPGASDFARLRRWMQHALQFGGRAFGSATDAYEALREVLEERDEAPRQNVLAFPAHLDTAPVIEIDSRGEAAAPAVDTAFDEFSSERETGVDVAAVWRAAQATGHAQPHAQVPFATPARSAESAATTESGPQLFGGVVARTPSPFTSLLRRVLARRDSATVAPRPSGFVTGALATVCVLQTIVIVGLLMVPPSSPPLIIERPIAVPAPLPVPAGALAPGTPPRTPGPAAQPGLAYVLTPVKEPSFLEKVWNAVTGVFSRSGGTAAR